MRIKGPGRGAMTVFLGLWLVSMVVMGCHKESAMSEPVAAAVEAIRQGNSGPSADLVDLGEPVVAPLSAYSDDPNVDVRRQVMKVLAAIASPGAFDPLVRLLEDDDIEIRSESAGALWSQFGPADYLEREKLPAALRASLGLGNDSPAALVLLGYFPTPENEALIREAAMKNPRPLKLLPGSKPVSSDLPGAVALAMMGNDESVGVVLEAIDSQQAPDLLFLLDVLRDIDSPTIIHALSATLHDQRIVSSGVPSGAEPARRICDEAVERFVNRLDLAVPFNLNSSRRYSADQIDAVKSGLRKSLPQ